MGKEFKKVGTHHGRFHADEVMATAILKEIYDLKVVRTRDNEVLNSCGIVYDVGGGEFDHHDVKKRYRESGTPYAACGLIWNAFGREAVLCNNPYLNEEEVDSTLNYVDDVLVEGIDAADNGLKTCDVIIRTANISSIIGGFNPQWYSDIPEDEAFHEAVGFASGVLRNTMKQRFSVIKAKEHVVEAYNNRAKPEVLALKVYCPWGETLNEIDTNGEVLFVIYPTKESYIIHTIRKKDGTFETRKDLPPSWAGKRDDELSHLIGIDDAVFCHPARFIAGARSLESVLKMADIAVSEKPDTKALSFFAALKRILVRK